MGKTIRRSIGDTDPMIFILREKFPGEDVSRPVSLVGKEVRITVVDSNIEEPRVFDGHVFGTEQERTDYFAAHSTELIDGLVTDISTYDPIIGVTHSYSRWRNSKWNTDFWLVVNDKLCRSVDASKGSVAYDFTTEEARRAGMFHVYYRVITNPGDPAETSSKYPKGESLWIHIMDIFTE